MTGRKRREVKVQIRVRTDEWQKAEQVAEKLGASISAAYRQAMNRFWDELFKAHIKKDAS